MAKILLLGGTGAMGIYVSPLLCDQGHAVHVTSRSSRGNPDGRINYIHGDGKDIDFVRDITAEHNFDAIIDFMVYSTEEFRNRRDRLLSVSGHYLYLSSYRVFSDTGGTPITERSPRLIDVCGDQAYLATDEYALAKGRQEDLLRDAKLSNWSILRPCITYSSNRFQLGTLEANAICLRAFQAIPVIMAREILKKTTTMTWAGDVAKLISQLTLNEAALGDDFNVVTAEHQPWSDVAAIYRETIGLKIVETDIATYENVVGGKYQIHYDRLLDRRLDNTKVLAATGVSQHDFLPLRSGLTMELAKFKENPSYGYVDFQVQAKMDNHLHTRLQLTDRSEAEKREYRSHRYPQLHKIHKFASKIYRKIQFSKNNSD